MVEVYQFNRKLGVEVESWQKDYLEGRQVFLDEVLDHEHRYRVVARSFFEFERELQEICLEYMFFSYSSVQKMEQFQRIEVKVVSLLSAIRGYHDQRQRLSKASCSARSTGALDEPFSEAYDQCFEYRLLEKVRNIVQHQDSLLISPSFNVRNDLAYGQRDGLRHQLFLSIWREKLLEYPHALKKNLRKEIENLDVDSFDFVHCCRVYGENFESAHKIVRDILSDEVNWSAGIMGWFFDKLRPFVSTKQLRSIELIGFEKGRGGFRDKKFISEGVLSNLKEILSESYFPNNYSVSYCSNEVSDKVGRHSRLK